MSLNTGLSIPEVRNTRTDHRTDDIDYVIKGAETQYVEIELDPGEAAIAEAGSMMHKDPDVSMSTLLGDGSDTEKTLINRVWGAGKRTVTGVGTFTTLFSHEGTGKAHVAFAAPYPGHIIALRLDDVGGELICQRDAFLCAARGVSLDLYLQKKVMTGIFGGDGFILQHLIGHGWVFVHVGGTVMERELAEGEIIDVDPGCVAAFTKGIDFDLVSAGSVRSRLFGGSGFFFARMTGPGKVWIQSLPFSRLAGRIGASVAVSDTKTEVGMDIAGAVGVGLIDALKR
ncbi:MAG: AIM24 family protein [Rhodobacteraceae bacterium]|nr:AIM24 family protein [Paracoccaceae bacterium]